MLPDIRLTLEEFNTAVQGGMRRMLESKEKYNHASSVPRTFMERLEQETAGACAEVAFKKILNAEIDLPCGTFHAVADALDDIEIRGTALFKGCLIVRDKNEQTSGDPAYRRYVLGITNGEYVRFIGWVYGYEARRREWLRNPGDTREAYFVPQEALRPMETLELEPTAAAAQ